MRTLVKQHSRAAPHGRPSLGRPGDYVPAEEEMYR